MYFHKIASLQWVDMQYLLYIPSRTVGVQSMLSMSFLWEFSRLHDIIFYFYITDALAMKAEELHC